MLRNPSLHRLALEQLIQQCRHSEGEDAPNNSVACRELLRRAVCANSDRAWDAVGGHLRTFLLRRIYAQRPEISPQEAERLIFYTLADFLTQLMRQPDLARHFPTYPGILTMLDNILAALIRRR
jgi:hypothetical protein